MIHLLNKDTVVRLSEKPVMGITTGVPKLDEAIHGYGYGKLITIAAFSDTGKTAFMVDGIIASRLQVPVGVFSIEMGSDEVIDRAIYNIAGLNAFRCRKFMTKKEKELYNEAVKEWEGSGQIYACCKEGKDRPEFINVDCMYPQFILDKSNPTDSIERAIVEMVEAGVGIIFLDYIQQVRWGFKADSETLRLKEITGKLKKMAMEYKIPIVILCQLTKEAANRATKKGEDPTPVVSDIRDGGFIINDSDIILLLYRPEAVNKTKEEINLLVDAEEEAQIIVAKGRNGPKGTLKVTYKAYCMSWRPREYNNEELF